MAWYSFVIGFCMIGLTVIPLVDHFTWTKCTIIALGSVGVLALFVQTILQSRKDHEWEKREDRRDMVLEEIAKNLAQPHGLAAGFSVSATVETLRERVAALAHDLFRFLKEKGHEPYRYEARFKDRVREIVGALRDRGLAKDVDEFVEPTGAQTAEKVQKLAERLLLIASKIEREEIMDHP